MLPLNYEDLYGLCEELQQLVTGQVQAVFNPNPNRYVLVFRQPGESRNLILDLTPSRPFILSTSSTKLKSQGKKTPLFNFLRSHFVNSVLEVLEIAQKPNRTLRFKFKGDREILFKCFPHGQHLVLVAPGKPKVKIVNYPLRPRDLELTQVTFVEPEKVDSWDINTRLADETMAENQGGATKALQPYHEVLIKKLERALTSLEEGILAQAPADQARIQVLENQALEAPGEDAQGIFDEIKRLKKKANVAQLRRQDLILQIDKLRVDPHAAVSAPPEKKAKGKKGEGEFSGTRVRISDHWELWVGRNAWQNDDLLRLGSSHDIWFHLRDYPGAHGLLRGPKKSEPTHAQVELAAQIVAMLSQSKKRPFSPGDKLDFIVTPRKFVKKRKGDPPGRVIVERETVRRIAFKSVKFQVI